MPDGKLETNSTTIKNLQKILADLGQGKISYALARELIAAEFQGTGMYSNPQETADRYLAAAGVGANAQNVTTPGVTPSAGADKTFWEKIGFAEEEPQAAWQRAQGLPAVGQNPFQKWMTGQATPAFAGWGAQQALAPGKTMTPFANYLTSGGGQMGQQSALAAINQMRGQGSEAQQNWMDLVGAEGGPKLGNVLESAMRGKGYAGFIANALANRIPALRTGWSARTLGGAQGDETLLDALMKGLGLY